MLCFWDPDHLIGLHYYNWEFVFSYSRLSMTPLDCVDHTFVGWFDRLICAISWSWSYSFALCIVDLTISSLLAHKQTSRSTICTINIRFYFLIMETCNRFYTLLSLYYWMGNLQCIKSYVWYRLMSPQNWFFWVFEIMESFTIAPHVIGHTLVHKQDIIILGCDCWIGVFLVLHYKHESVVCKCGFCVHVTETLTWIDKVLPPHPYYCVKDLELCLPYW